ncbi:MAG: hypothetical protein P1V20_31705 [Verrucomicrobiales bacterium]|nr:hypothetical protein [Verrucomicrobiales bacterium]
MKITHVIALLASAALLWSCSEVCTSCEDCQECSTCAEGCQH